MKILVTGGAGFIGSNFIRFVLDKTKDSVFAKASADRQRPKTRIVNLDKLTYSGNLENLRDVAKDPRYKFVKGDICNKALVSAVMRGCDTVINFAAESHVDRSIRDASQFINTNVNGTRVLLDAARKYKVKRFIQISTDEVYGSIRMGRFKETSPLLPNSPYAATKAAADLLVRSYIVTYGTPALIVRSCNNFGPFQYPEKVIPLFITNAIGNKKVPLYADGTNVREWLYVKDNCDAIYFVMERGKTGEIYNIGSANEMKNIDLTRRILCLLGRGPELIEFVKDRPGHDKRYALDTGKLRRLGWKPEHRFENALDETVAWYKDNVKWWKRLKRKEKFW